MSYYSDASLVLIPSGYKNQKVYSAKPTDGSGDLTFTRASDATRVDSNGLIEKVRTNLAPYSSDFSQQYILIDATISTNTTTDPFGTSLADSHLETATSSTHTGFTDYTVTSGAELSYSIYAKSIGGRNIRVGGSVGWASVAVVDLSNGTLLGGSTADAKVTSVGNGWYRISITATTSGTIARVLVYSLDGTTTSFAGDVTKGIHIFGRQLEYGVPTDYIPTTTAAVSVGPVSGLPRLDYSGGASCPSLLLEPQRTNLLTYSEQFDNTDWTKNSTTITANATTSPDGYQNADLSTVSSSSQVLSQFPSVTAGTSFVWSVYAKAGNWDIVRLGQQSSGINGAWFNLSTKTVGTVNGGTAEIIEMGNGWLRLVTKFNSWQTGNQLFIGISDADGSTTTAPIGSTMYFYGAQLETNATYATSYIPTLGSAVTRLADAASKTGISSLIGQTEGTMFVEVNLTSIKPGTFLSISEGTTANRVDFGVSAANLFFIVRISATESASTVQTVSGTVVVGRYKIAVGYKSGNTIFYINGVQSLPQITDTFTFVNALTKLSVGNARNDTAQMGDGVTQAALFPTRLTNAQLAELTTL